MSRKCSCLLSYPASSLVPAGPLWPVPWDFPGLIARDPQSTRLGHSGLLAVPGTCRPVRAPGLCTVSVWPRGAGSAHHGPPVSTSHHSHTTHSEGAELALSLPPAAIRRNVSGQRSLGPKQCEISQIRDIGRREFLLRSAPSLHSLWKSCR